MSYGSNLMKAIKTVKPSRLTQPYRRGARSPGAALDAMRLGASSPSPGAALHMSSSRKQNGYEPMGRTPNPGRRRAAVRIPRM